MWIERATRKAMKIGGWIGHKNKYGGYTLMKPEEYFKMRPASGGDLMRIRRMEWSDYFANWKAYTTEEVRAICVLQLH